MAARPPLPEIDNPLEAPGWRVSRPDDDGALHAQVLCELTDGARWLHVGAAGARGIAATLHFVDRLQEQVVLASHEDGIAVARALQARPVWAAANLHSLRVQFVLMAASAARESFGRAGAPSERFAIRARWPRDIYRTSRRRTPRLAQGPQRAPLARLLQGHLIAGTRDFAVLDLSEGGGALRLPAGTAPPAPGSEIRGIELDLDDDCLVVTDAVVVHVSAVPGGALHLGCRWQGMAAGGQRSLRRWLAEAAAPADSADG
jgi:hypothetical protein